MLRTASWCSKNSYRYFSKQGVFFLVIIQGHVKILVMALNLNLKILVIDDLTSARKMIQNQLEEIGFRNILQAASGNEAFEIMSKAKNSGAPFEFIIADYIMDDMDGLELFHSLKTDVSLSKIPFLFITGEDDQNILNQLTKAGSKEILLKPFSTGELQEKIEILTS